MLRQAILTPSRAASSTLRLAGKQAFIPSRPQFYRAPAAIATRAAAQPSFRRWYSAAETEQKGSSEAAKDAAAAAAAAATAATAADSKTAEQSQTAESANGAAAETQDAEAALKKQLDAKEAEARDWKDKYMRSVADFRNLQDRTQRDMKSARDFAIQKFAKDLIDSIDNLDRALLTVPGEKLNAEQKTEHLQDLVNLYEGLKMTESVLMQTLQKHGLERFDPAGEKFDPNEHEATFMTPMPDKEENTVFHVQQKGFKLNGRVLRAAKVGVVKNK